MRLLFDPHYRPRFRALLRFSDAGPVGAGGSSRHPGVRKPAQKLPSAPHPRWRGLREVPISRNKTSGHSMWLDVEHLRLPAVLLRSPALVDLGGCHGRCLWLRRSVRSGRVSPILVRRTQDRFQCIGRKPLRLLWQVERTRMGENCQWHWAKRRGRPAWRITTFLCRIRSSRDRRSSGWALPCRCRTAR